MFRCLGKKVYKKKASNMLEKEKQKRERRLSEDLTSIRHHEDDMDLQMAERPKSMFVGDKQQEEQNGGGYESAPDDIASINWEMDGTPILAAEASIEKRKNKHKGDRVHSFLRAARAGDVEKMKVFLENGVAVESSNTNGLNAMHLASKEGNCAAVEFLIQKGLSVDLATRKGNTSLHIASLAGKLDIVRLLVENHANIDIQSQNGFTPLYMAAQENHYEVVSYLLSNGANQGMMTDDGFTPLAVALQQGNDKVVQLLLDNDSRTSIRLPALHIAAKKDDTNAASLLLGATDDNVDHQSPNGFTALHIAAQYNNLNTANLLINRNANINFQAKNNVTPLHMASKFGRLEMVKLLLNKSANQNSETRDGYTPLLYAAGHGHIDIVQTLIDNGANILNKTKNGFSALHLAAQRDQAEMCQFLIKNGINVDLVTSDYLTPLHVATHNGNLKAAEILLKNKANVNSRALNGFTPLHIACKKNLVTTAALLLQNRANMNCATETGLTPLHIASFVGSKDIVTLLLRNGALISQTTLNNETAIHLATNNCQEDTLRVLLEKSDGKELVNAKARDNKTALHIASKVGNYAIVDLLLHAGADPNLVTTQNCNALHIAAKSGRHEITRILLEKIAKPDAKTMRGFTALHLAAKFGRIQVARQLLMLKKADPNVPAHKDLTPLHVAILFNHPEMVSLLLDMGANIESPYRNGYTAIHMVKKENKLEIGQILIERGANVNAKSHMGYTSLHINSMMGNFEIVKLLLQAGADVNYQSDEGITSLHLASEKNTSVEIVDLLLEHGANQQIASRSGFQAIHSACHAGHIGNVKKLLSRPDCNVNSQTKYGSTPLHLAAQQGHLTLVSLLLEAGADPNIRNMQKLTSLEIAERLHYLNIAQILNEVTTLKSIPTPPEETPKLIMDQPERPVDHSISDSEDDGSSSLNITAASSRTSLNLSIREISRTNSLRRKPRRPISVGNVSFDLGYRHPANAYPITPTPSQKDWEVDLESVQLIQRPLKAGFLISFIVDAQGCMMQAQRHPDLKLYVPVGSVDGPTRIICHLQRKENFPTIPILEDSESLACRIIHINASVPSLDGPILIEIPHNAALRHGEREVIVVKSDDGANWKEHTVICSDVAIKDALGTLADDLPTTDYQTRNRVQRIITTQLPQFFSLISRPKQDFGFIGSEGGVVVSSVCPKVQVVFPEGALTKKIKIAIQVQNISSNTILKYFGTGVGISPIVTLEPRRRKFHKPITLTLPLPHFLEKGQSTSDKLSGSCLRLLCSISGHGTQTAWEDITGTSPLSVQDGTVSFTTTISARVWLIDCNRINEIITMANAVYKHSCVVPFIGQFLIYSRRYSEEESQIRCLCITDDTAEKTLEYQENFELISSGPPVEILENHRYYMEYSGNLVPITKSNEQLSIKVIPFKENRLSFIVRIKDLSNPPSGRFAFMEDPRPGTKPISEENEESSSTAAPAIPTIKEEQETTTTPQTPTPTQPTTTTTSIVTQIIPQKPLCTLDINLPDKIIRPSYMDIDDMKPNDVPYDPEKQKEEACRSMVKSELNIREVSNKVGGDWQKLITALGLGNEEICRINIQPGTEEDKAYVALLLWISTSKDRYKGNRLEEALRDIGREDVVKTCIHSVSALEEEEQKSAESSLSGAAVGDRISHSISESSEKEEEEEEAEVSPDTDSEVIKVKHVERKVPLEAKPTMSEEEKSKLKEEKFIELINAIEDALPDPELLFMDTKESYDMNNVDEVDEGTISMIDVRKDEAGVIRKDPNDYSAVPDNYELEEEIEDNIQPRQRTKFKEDEDSNEISGSVIVFSDCKLPKQIQNDIEVSEDITTESMLDSVETKMDKTETVSAEEKVEEKVEEAVAFEEPVTEEPSEHVEEKVEEVETVKEDEPVAVEEPVDVTVVEKVEEVPESMTVDDEKMKEISDIDVTQLQDVSAQEITKEDLINQKTEITEHEEVQAERLSISPESDDIYTATQRLREEEKELTEATDLLNRDDSPDECDIKQEFSRNYSAAALSIDNLSNNDKITCSLANISDTMTSPSSNDDVKSSLGSHVAALSDESKLDQTYSTSRPSFNNTNFFQDLLKQEETESYLTKLDSPVDHLDEIQDVSESTTTTTTCEPITQEEDSSIASSIMDQQEFSSFSLPTHQHDIIDDKEDLLGPQENLPTPINEQKSIVTADDVEMKKSGYSQQSSGFYQGPLSSREDYSDDYVELVDKQHDSGYEVVSKEGGDKKQIIEELSSLDDDENTNADISLASDMTLKGDSEAGSDRFVTVTKEADGFDTPENYSEPEDIDETTERKADEDFVEVIEEFEEDPALSPIIECLETTDSSSEKITKGTSSDRISMNDSAENVEQIKDEVASTALQQPKLYPKSLQSRIPTRINYEIPKEEEEFADESSYDSYSTVLVAGAYSSMGSSLHSDIHTADTPLQQQKFSTIQQQLPTPSKSDSQDSSLEELHKKNIVYNVTAVSMDAVYKRNSQNDDQKIAGSDSAASSDPLNITSKDLELSHSLPRVTASSSSHEKTTRLLHKSALGRSIELKTDSSSLRSSLKEFEMLEKELATTSSLTKPRGGSSIDSTDDGCDEKVNMRENIGSYTSSLAEFEILEEAAHHSDDNIRKSILSAFTLESALGDGISSGSISHSGSSSLAEFEQLEQALIQSEMKEEAGKIVRALEEGVLPTIPQDSFMAAAASTSSQQTLGASGMKDIPRLPTTQLYHEDLKQSMRDSMSMIQQLLTTELSDDRDLVEDVELDDDGVLDTEGLGQIGELPGEDDDDEPIDDSDSLDGSTSRPGSILQAGDAGGASGGHKMASSIHSSEISDSQEYYGGVSSYGGAWGGGVGGTTSTDEYQESGGMPASMSVDSALSWSVNLASGADDNSMASSSGAGVSSGAGGGGLTTTTTSGNYAQDTSSLGQMMEYSEPLSDIPQEPDDYVELEQIPEDYDDLQERTDNQLNSLDDDGNFVIVQSEEPLNNEQQQQ